MIRLSLVLTCLAGPAMADRILAEASCAPTATEMLYRCDITLSAGGAPVEAAAFTVAPSMPSMPMAHNIPPVPAVASDTPGTYAVDLHLDMAGDWVLTLDLSEPRRDRVVISQTFAPPDAATNGMDHSAHEGASD